MSSQLRKSNNSLKLKSYSELKQILSLVCNIGLL